MGPVMKIRFGTRLSQKPARELGFSLVELLVSIAILAILIALAAPSFSSVSLTGKLTASANRLLATANLARSEAIKRNATVNVCKSANLTSCVTTGGWEQGWIVISGTEVLTKEQAAPGGIRVTSSVNALDFVATGVGSTQADFTVCQATPTVGTQERVVSVSATGRSSIKKTVTGVCS